MPKRFSLRAVNRLTLIAIVGKAHDTATGALAQVELLRRTVIPAARASLSTVEAGYGQGRYTLLEQGALDAGTLKDYLRRISAEHHQIVAAIAAGDSDGARAALRTHLVANATFAQRNGVAFRVAAIPGDRTVSSLDFSQESMQSLFELGRSSAAAGQAWGAMNAGATVAAIARDPADEAGVQPEAQPSE